MGAPNYHQSRLAPSAVSVGRHCEPFSAFSKPLRCRVTFYCRGPFRFYVSCFLPAVFPFVVVAITTRQIRVVPMITVYPIGTFGALCFFCLNHDCPVASGTESDFG